MIAYQELGCSRGGLVRIGGTLAAMCRREPAALTVIAAKSHRLSRSMAVLSRVRGNHVSPSGCALSRAPRALLKCSADVRNECVSRSGMWWRFCRQPIADAVERGAARPGRNPNGPRPSRSRSSRNRVLAGPTPADASKRPIGGHILGGSEPRGGELTRSRNCSASSTVAP
jgi:hypothetical protein